MSFSISDDPINRYNALSYRAIIKGFSSDIQNQVQVLQILSEMLVFANDSLLSDFPLQEMCKRLVSLISTSQSEEVISLSCQCIFSLMEVNRESSRIFMRFNIINILNAKMIVVKRVPTIENIFRVFSQIANTNPDALGEAMGIQIFLDMFNQVSKIEQKTLISTVAAITQSYVKEKFSESLESLINIIENQDSFIHNNALTSFSQIINVISSKSIPNNLYPLMINVLYRTNDNSVAVMFTKVIHRGVKDHYALRALMNQLPDFECLLYSSCARANPEICSQLIEIAQYMIPPPVLPRHLWHIKNLSFPNSQELVHHLENVLVKFLCERLECEHIAIVTLAGCVSLVSLKPTTELLNVLLRLAKVPKTAPYVLSIAANLTSKVEVIRAGIIELLKGTPVSSSHREWYKERIRTFTSSINGSQSGTITPFMNSLPATIAFSQTLESVIKFIKDESIMPYEFLQSNLIEKCSSIIRNSSKITTDISILISLAYGILDFQPFPKISDPFRMLNINHFTKRMIPVSIIAPKGLIKDYMVSLMWDFMTIEGWYNLEYNPKAFDRLQELLQSKTPLQRMIEKQNIDQIYDEPLRFALLCRAFRIDKYIQCSFKCRSHVFSAYDNIHHALACICPTPESLAQFKFEIQLYENEAPRAEFFVSNFESNEMKKALDFLFLVHSKAPQMFYINPAFPHHAFLKMNSPYLIMMHYDPIIKLIYKYPFLFTFKDRKFIFRVIGLDPNIGIKELQKRLFPESERSSTNVITLHCTVDRKRILDEGSFLMMRLGCGRLKTVFNFADEIGTGNGPTQEFFSLLSRYYCLKELRMWRDDSDEHSKYSWNSRGLFPLPSVNGALLEELGILCSKAIILEKIVDIPFNPAFFRLIMGHQVTVADVDPVLANSLNYKEGLYGLNFVYPCQKRIELKPNGNNIFVDETNVDEYISLITDFTCGKYMFERVKAFIRGFEKNIPRGALKLFTADEIAALISGEEVSYNMNDLQKFVQIEHGYSNESPEIKMLYSIIVNMSKEEKKLFTKFITGCERLPAGGLSSLYPKLTIAKRLVNGKGKPDDSLPSIMTCTHYFKLPQYSSQEIMKKKILQAINEGQNTFQLS